MNPTTKALIEQCRRMSREQEEELLGISFGNQQSAAAQPTDSWRSRGWGGREPPRSLSFLPPAPRDTYHEKEEDEGRGGGGGTTDDGLPSAPRDTYNEEDEDRGDEGAESDEEEEPDEDCSGEEDEGDDEWTQTAAEEAERRARAQRTAVSGRSEPDASDAAAKRSALHNVHEAHGVKICRDYEGGLKEHGQGMHSEGIREGFRRNSSCGDIDAEIIPMRARELEHFVGREGMWLLSGGMPQQRDDRWPSGMVVAKFPYVLILTIDGDYGPAEEDPQHQEALRKFGAKLCREVMLRRGGHPKLVPRAWRNLVRKERPIENMYLCTALDAVNTRHTVWLCGYGRKQPADAFFRNLQLTIDGLRRREDALVLRLATEAQYDWAFELEEDRRGTGHLARILLVKPKTAGLSVEAHGLAGRVSRKDLYPLFGAWGCGYGSVTETPIVKPAHADGEGVVFTSGATSSAQAAPLAQAPITIEKAIAYPLLKHYMVAGGDYPSADYVKDVVPNGFWTKREAHVDNWKDSMYYGISESDAGKLRIEFQITGVPLEQFPTGDQRAGCTYMSRVLRELAWAQCMKLDFLAVPRVLLYKQLQTAISKVKEVGLFGGRAEAAAPSWKRDLWHELQNIAGWANRHSKRAQRDLARGIVVGPVWQRVNLQSEPAAEAPSRGDDDDMEEDEGVDFQPVQVELPSDLPKVESRRNTTHPNELDVPDIQYWDRVSQHLGRSATGSELHDIALNTRWYVKQTGRARLSHDAVRGWEARSGAESIKELGTHMAEAVVNLCEWQKLYPEKSVDRKATQQARRA